MSGTFESAGSDVRVSRAPVAHGGRAGLAAGPLSSTAHASQTALAEWAISGTGRRIDSREMFGTSECCEAFAASLSAAQLALLAHVAGFEAIETNATIPASEPPTSTLSVCESVCIVLIFNDANTTPTAVVRRAASRLDAGFRLARFGFTPRQAQVAAWVTKGLSTREVAERGGMTVATVRRHLEAIYLRVGCRSRTELVARVLSATDRRSMR